MGDWKRIGLPAHWEFEHNRMEIGMNRTWEDNATEFGALTKQGIDVRLALLVACSVEKGKGNGGDRKSDQRNERNADPGGKTSAREFAKKAGTSAPRVLRHLKAWDAASPDLTSKDLQPDNVDMDVPEELVERFHEVWEELQIAAEAGSRPRDSKPEHAVQIIEKRGAQAVVDAMSTEQRKEVVEAAVRTDRKVVPTAAKVVGEVREREFREAVYEAGGLHPDEPMETFAFELTMEAQRITARWHATETDIRALRRRCEPDEWDKIQKILDKGLSRLQEVIYGAVPDDISEITEGGAR